MPVHVTKWLKLKNFLTFAGYCKNFANLLPHGPGTSNDVELKLFLITSVTEIRSEEQGARSENKEPAYPALRQVNKNVKRQRSSHKQASQCPMSNAFS
jgi:hypothetical protein